MQIWRTWRAALLLTALAATMLTIAACGGSDDDGDETPTPEPGATENSDAGNGGEDDGNGEPTDDNGEPADEATSTPEQADTPDADATPGGPVDGDVGSEEGSTAVQELPADPSPAEKTAQLVDVRTGVHPEEGGWDRIVFEFAGTQLPESTVGYVPRALECGSGEEVELPGEEILVARFNGAMAHDEEGNVTIDATEIEGHGDTMLSAHQTCDFEAQVSWHMGISAEQPFKVKVLEDPTRVVVDIEH